MSRENTPVNGRRTLEQAFFDSLSRLKRIEGRDWRAGLDSLRHAEFHHRKRGWSVRLRVIEEAAALLGVDIGTRAGWLRFAEMVAERLPNETGNSGWWGDGA